jgi:hypothetical protein
MIHGYMALRRQLRQFVYAVGLTWDEVIFSPERDDEGNVIGDDARAEIAFRARNGKFVELAIFAPSTDRDHRPDGKNVLPLGKVAARVEGRVISGPIDQITWKNIRDAINV